MTKIYQPPQAIIDKYAEVLVDFALGGGTGIKKGEVVWVQGSEASRPLYLALMKLIWRRGGHTISDYGTDTYSEADNLGRYFYEVASDEQISFLKRDYLRGLAKQADHRVAILSETNVRALEGIDPAKIMKRGLAIEPFRKWLEKKENSGNYTWVLGLYGTAALAKEAGLSLEEYWQQIIKACFLDKADPIGEWKRIYAEIAKIIKKLNALAIQQVRVTGDDMDLTVKIGQNRQWAGGGGRNIPSFEIFTSPDWRGTTGWARFNQPLYYYGNIIEGIELEFAAGRVVKAKASKNQKVLKEMVATKNADKVGEFSLTDSRFSRIDKFMADTLFDENRGGKFGNTHIALGTSFHDCYAGDASKVTKAEWARLGFNESSVHTDIVSTANRQVTAILADGSLKVIYENGQFKV